MPKVREAIDILDVSPVYAVLTDMMNACADEVKGLSNATQLTDYMGDYGEKFNKCYRLEYLKYMYKTPNRKKENESLEKMKQMDKELIEQLMSVDEGYKPLAVAEKNGAKIDWNKVPLTAILSPGYIDFLAKKGYDFDAKRTVNGVKTDFTSFNLTLMSVFENQTYERYEDVVKAIEEHNRIIRSGKPLLQEYRSPETTEKRKQEILKEMDKSQKAFDAVLQSMPAKCDAVNESMNRYYIHAALLEHAIITNKYVSPENIKKVNPDKLLESIGGMNYRREKMEKINKAFNSKQTSKTDEKEQGSLMTASVYGSEGVFGTLASAENGKAVYAKEAEAEKSGMSMTERLAQQTQGLTLESAENAMAFVGKDSQTNA